MPSPWTHRRIYEEEVGAVGQVQDAGQIVHPNVKLDERAVGAQRAQGAGHRTGQQVLGDVQDPQGGQDAQGLGREAAGQQGM